MRWSVEKHNFTKDEVNEIVRENRGRKPRYLFDENIAPEWAAIFKEIGCHAKHVQEVGLNHSDDKLIYQFAVRQEYIIVTRDADYMCHQDFPFNLRCGVFILSDAQGDYSAFLNSLSLVIYFCNPFFKEFYGSKCTFYPDGTITYTKRIFDGSLIHGRYSSKEDKFYRQEKINDER